MRTALVLGLALLGVTADAVAQPKPPADAERRSAAEHFRKGQAAQKAERFREAIEEYEQAHALVPHPNTLFNIAVCYEKLGEWSQAADYYERYLDEPGEHRDAATVKDKIAELRARSQPVAPPPVAEQPAVVEQPATPEPTAEPMALPTAAKRGRVHVGLSYGIGFGDAPTERYLGYGGIQIAERFELDAILGKFGKNDLAIGVQGKVLLDRIGRLAPFGRGAVTLGYATQDASSAAESRFPIGFEAGGGVLFGARGRFELAAVVRWTRGGFDMESTVVDSYVNDTYAIAIDLGFAFDLASDQSRSAMPTR